MHLFLLKYTVVFKHSRKYYKLPSFTPSSLSPLPPSSPPLKQMRMNVAVALLLQLLQLNRARSSINLHGPPYLSRHNTGRQLAEY